MDQSVSSNARRAASMARCMSAFDAFATSPIDLSVAGLMLVKVPSWPSASLPSIIIFDSNRTVGVSDIVLASSNRAETRNSHHQPRHVVQSDVRKQAVG